MDGLVTSAEGWFLVMAVGLSGFFSWLAAKAKAKSDRVAQVPDGDSVLSDVIEDLRRDRDKDRHRLDMLEAELGLLRVIARLKYPIALHVIREFLAKYPDAGIHISDQIAGDL